MIRSAETIQNANRSLQNANPGALILHFVADVRYEVQVRSAETFLKRQPFATKCKPMGL
jgi:hypothetical protein